MSEQGFFPGDPRSRAELARVGGVPEAPVVKAENPNKPIEGELVGDMTEAVHEKGRTRQQVLDDLKTIGNRMNPVERDGLVRKLKEEGVSLPDNINEDSPNGAWERWRLREAVGYVDGTFTPKTRQPGGGNVGWENEEKAVSYLESLGVDFGGDVADDGEETKKNEPSAEKPKVKPGPGGAVAELDAALRDYLDMPDGKTKSDLVQAFMKKNGDKVSSTLRKEALAALSINERSASPGEALREIVEMQVDASFKKTLLGNWIRTHGKNAGEALLQEAARFKNSLETIGSEIELDEMSEVDMRERMIAEVVKLSPESNIDTQFDIFLKSQISRMGRVNGKFSENVEELWKKEFVARAELQMASGFWFELAASQQKKALEEASTKSVDRCRKLSRSTYEWLATQNELKFRKRDASGSVVGIDMTTGENGIKIEKEYSNQIDNSLKIIYDKIHLSSGALNLWDISTAATLNEEIQKIVDENPRISKDAAIMAWQLAVAECWGADRGFGFISHPVFKLVHPDTQRDFIARDGTRPVPGGTRLLVEYRQLHDGLMPPSGVNVFTVETPVSWTKPGFDLWTNRGGREAAMRGNYLKSFLEVIHHPFVGGRLTIEGGVEIPGRAFEDTYLPQTELMNQIGKGATAWTAMEELGKADPTKAAPELLTAFRDAMADATQRHEPWSYKIADRFVIARKKLGPVLFEWAKSVMWQGSWANPSNASKERLVMPVATQNELFLEILNNFLSDGECRLSAQVVGKPAGYGGILGFGLPRNQSNEMAIQFIKWFNKTIQGANVNALVYKRVKGKDGKKYGNTVSAERKKKDAANDMLQGVDTEALLYGAKSLFVEENRWWRK